VAKSALLRDQRVGLSTLHSKGESNIAVNIFHEIGRCSYKKSNQTFIVLIALFVNFIHSNEGVKARFIANYRLFINDDYAWRIYRAGIVKNVFYRTDRYIAFTEISEIRIHRDNCRIK
jgi:hypothetical protein